MQSVRDTARELMRGYCRVCPVCNGRVCAGEVPGMGGLGTGAAFQANITALDRKKLVMRLVHEVTAPELSLSLLGLDLSLPVLAAPIGGVAFNMGGKRTEEEYIRAIVDGCVRAGTIGCTGDGVPPEILDSGLAAVASAGGMGIPFIKPWEDEELFRKIDKARQSGARVMGMDIDAAGLVTLRKMGRPVSPKPVSALREVIRRADRPFIIKGVMCVEDAELALEAGAQAIIVSNHGGRVLDQTPGGADVLPEIAARMKGRLVILADGGVRSGVDVLKMLALGADAVLIGRPFSVAAVGGLADGVAMYVEKLRTELLQAMVMTGTASVRSVSPDILVDGACAG